MYPSLSKIPVCKSDAFFTSSPTLLYSYTPLGCQLFDNKRSILDIVPVSIEYIKNPVAINGNKIITPLEVYIQSSVHKIE